MYSLVIFVCAITLVGSQYEPFDNYVERNVLDPDDGDSAEGIPGSTPHGQPHVVLVIADDMGWHDIGYHDSDAATPVLDELAYSGVRLENYHAEPTCSPSRGCLLTGYYTFNNGIVGNLNANDRQALPLHFNLLPERMRELGYVTRMVGKWHLGFFKLEYMPTRRGFDSFIGFTGSQEGYYSHTECVNMFFAEDDYYRTCGQNLYNATSSGSSILSNPVKEYGTTLWNAAAVDTIEQHDATRPLFLYLSEQAPHLPLQVPEYYMQYVSDDVENTRRRIFDGMVYAMDEGIGNVTRALKDKGMWNNTVFIFASDNGGSHIGYGCNYPLRGEKGSLYEGGIRVPAFVSGPLVEQAGTVNNDLIHVTDWYNTIIHLGGGNSTEGDGYDMWGVISRGEPSPRDEIAILIKPDDVSGVSAYPDIYDTAVRSCLIWRQWKLITGSAGDCTVYGPYGQGNKPKVLECPHPSDKNLWLFNIVEDWQESYDLSSVHTDLVVTMLWKLAEYNRTALYYPPPEVDLLSDPQLYGGYWVPWADARWHDTLMIDGDVSPVLENLLRLWANNSALNDGGEPGTDHEIELRPEKTLPQL